MIYTSVIYVCAHLQSTIRYRQHVCTMSTLDFDSFISNDVSDTEAAISEGYWIRTHVHKFLPSHEVGISTSSFRLPTVDLVRQTSDTLRTEFTLRLILKFEAILTPKETCISHLLTTSINTFPGMRIRSRQSTPNLSAFSFGDYTIVSEVARDPVHIACPIQSRRIRQLSSSKTPPRCELPHLLRTCCYCWKDNSCTRIHQYNSYIRLTRIANTFAKMDIQKILLVLCGTNVMFKKVDSKDGRPST